MTTAYHATKCKEYYEAILKTSILLPGKNVSTDKRDMTHISLNPFYPGSWALDVIGENTNEAWIFEIQIPDNTSLLPDPSGDGEHYNGGWMVHLGMLHVKVVSVTYISDVIEWESSKKRAPKYEQRVF